MNALLGGILLSASVPASYRRRNRQSGGYLAIPDDFQSDKLPIERKNQNVDCLAARGFANCIRDKIGRLAWQKSAEIHRGTATLALSHHLQRINLCRWRRHRICRRHPNRSLEDGPLVN